MVITIEKTSTFVYKFLKFVYFGKLDSDVITNMPARFQKCFKCERVMKYGEKIYLGIMPHDNKIFCEECASEFLEIEARRSAKTAELLGSVPEMQGSEKND